MIQTFGQSMALVFSCLLLAACSTSAPVPVAQRQPDPAHGKVIYTAQCAGCHEKGRKNAPSIKDAEEWDIQTLKAPGVLARHSSMRGGSGLTGFGPLPKSDEVDVLTYIEGQVNEVDPKY